MGADILDELELMRFTRIDPIRENAILKRAKDEIGRLREKVGELAIARSKDIAEIGRLRGEADALRQCGIKYLGWLGVKDAENGLRKDMSDPEMVERPAPAMPNGVEEMVAYLDNWLSREHGLNLGRVKVGDAVDAALRAADNRDAAGVHTATSAPAEAKGDGELPTTDAEVEADNAKAANAACLLAIASGYAWSGKEWRQVRTPHPADGEAVEFVAVPDDYRNQASGYRAGWTDAMNAAPVQAAPQEGEAMDRGPWRRKGARFYSDDFTHDVSLVVGGDFGSDEVEDRYLDWLLSVLNGPAGAALQHRGDSKEVGRG